MSENVEKKKAPPKSREELIALHERRAMRLKWAGWREALGMLVEATKLVEEAHAAVGADVDVATKGALDGARAALGNAQEKIGDRIPPEAR